MTEVINTFRYMNHEDFAAILGKSLFALLEDNEGVYVHYADAGFIVCKVFDDKHQEWQVKVMDDEEALKHPDLRKVWVHDEPVGNA